MPLLEHLGTETVEEPIPEHVPDLEASRPGNCPGCGTPARVQGKVILQGHGCRRRKVVLPARTEGSRARLVWLIVRRFRCIGCRKSCTVLPPGVFQRYLYSLFSILLAWLGALSRPLGEGRSEPEVYALQGVDGLEADENPFGFSRWRSLSRWSRQVEAWWPSRPVTGGTWRERVTLLVRSFCRSAQSLEPAALAQRALCSHILCGGVF